MTIGKVPLPTIEALNEAMLAGAARARFELEKAQREEARILTELASLHRKKASLELLCGRDESSAVFMAALRPVEGPEPLFRAFAFGKLLDEYHTTCGYQKWLL